MTLSHSILATLTYHDIFEYPLRLEEIHQYLIDRRAGLKTIKAALADLENHKKIIFYSSSASHSNILYALPSRKNIFNLRSQRAKYSRAKLKKAKFFAKLLKIIPSVKLVAISGALAMNNSHKNDDIDLVLVSSKGKLWTTRFISTLTLFPYKRRPKAKITSNKACLNLILDESKLNIKDQNIYTAHEICQMKPVWNRDRTYQKFIKANSWIKKYLPNSQPTKVESGKLKVESPSSKKFSIFNSQLSILEILMKNFQLAYMRSKITTEKIGKHQLFFHPADTQGKVLSEFKKRLKKYRIKFTVK